LVRRGWFESEQAVVAVLTKHESQTERYPYETAGPAADWFAARLAAVPAKDGVCAAARAIRRFPRLLTLMVETLQRGWDTLLRPQADGGLGCMPERAARHVCAQPQVLGFTPEHVLKTVAAVEACGVADGLKAVMQQPILLGFAASTLQERAAWWRQTGLDYKKILSAQPALLERSSKLSHKHLQAKLDFFRDVARMTVDALNKAPALFSLSLDGRFRPRFFYALRNGTADRYSMGTLMNPADPIFVAYALGRNGLRSPASAAEVASYKETVASAEFIAWREREEALRRMDG
jgi:hypothetical protein